MKTIISLCLLAAATLMQDSIAQTPVSEAQKATVFKATVSTTLQASYLLYLPKDYGKDPTKKWPVLVFLHGSGESGTDIEAVKQHGPPKLIAQGKEFPFIVVSPQAASPEQGWRIDVLNALLDNVIAHHRVDQDRVYLTGLSMGGFGTWAWATANPERFAAVAPICGGGVAHYAASRMKNLPVWAFHGGKDSVVALGETFNMINALNRAGAAEVKYSIYPEAGHDSWTQAYNDENLYRWLLSHKRAN